MADALKDLALKDSKKAERDGTLVGPGIAGLKLIKPVTHVDHRGALFEIYDGDLEKWPDPVVWIYQTSLYPGVIKGWFVHDHKTDRYTLVYGTILAAFYDGREDSPTYGNTVHATMSDRGIRQIVIPAGVWHVIVNLGTEEAHLMNFPTRPHNHEEPDRRGLPWNTELIPLRLRDLLPANWSA